MGPQSSSSCSTIPQRRLAVYPDHRECFHPWSRRRRWSRRKGAVVSRLGVGWRRLWDMEISFENAEIRGKFMRVMALTECASLR